ncbi:MAG TPA: DJ-1/PfpI family protein, partial [Ktedonobacterales bacterium]|nr:DJ-1/PfpI family protein [Ktedonobacterales bacterium]
MRLSGKTVGVFVAPEFEDLEFWVPVMRLREEGARVIIIGLSHETVTGKHCLTAAPDIVAGEVRPDALDAVVVPGGWAPDKLRRDADVLRLV